MEHEYNIYADNVLFFKKIIKHKEFHINDDIIMKEKFDVAIEGDFENLTVKLFLHRINRKGIGNIILKITEKDNFINIIHKRINFNLINENSDNISSNLEKIKENENDIDTINSNTYILNPKYTLDEIYLFNVNFVKEIEFKSDIKKLLIYEAIIEDNLSENSYLEMYESILYSYDSLKTSYHILKELYEILDENDNILDSFSFHPVSKGFVMRQFHVFENVYYYKIVSDINHLKIKLYLQLIAYDNISEFNLKLTNEFQKNFICIKYFKNDNLSYLLANDKQT